ncbi:MAG: hypothetical protein WC069_02380 [Candidatus Shapirobacteria bacterium]
MLSLKNKILKIIVGYLVFVSMVFGGFFVISSIPSKTAISDDVVFETKFIKLTEFKNYRGYFESSYNNLNRVDVLFKNPNLESRDELLIAITDFEKTIYQQNFTGYNFGDTSRARLDFSPIVNSKNIKYTINIIPTKIVDGKLAIGIKDNNLDLIHYYDRPFDFKSSFSNSLHMMQNKVLIWPLILLTIFLW